MVVMDGSSRGEGAPWWQDAVIYHIYPRSFRDTDGDGVGDLPGVIAGLDYLRWLGVDAIWLSPFYRSPGVDFGYDVAGHTEVDPALGTLADVDRLVAQAHERGIRVLLDFVSSNTSVQHPWFVESRGSRASAKRDWYIWRDPGPRGYPNNWVAVFGGPAWTWDERTSQYYLHSFLPEIPDLNWRNPEVEAAMFDVLRFWLDRGVDGFRIDAAEHPLKDSHLRDDPPAPPKTGDPAKNLGEYDSLLHVHDRGHPDIHGLYRRVRTLLDEHVPGRPAVAIAEVVPEPGRGYAHWASFYGEHLDEIQLPLNLTLPSLPWSAAAYRRSLTDVGAAIPPGGWPSLVLGSHDEPRVASRYDRGRALALAFLLLGGRGTPVLYYGDELALPSPPVPMGEERDPWGRRNPAFNRDLGRTPMPWTTDDRWAGFTTGPQPWLPMAVESTSLSVQDQREDPHSALSVTRRLLHTRRRRVSLRRGTLEWLDAGDDVLAFRRRWESEVTDIFINFADEAIDLDASAELIAGSSADVLLSSGRLTLPGHGAAMIGS